MNQFEGENGDPSTPTLVGPMDHGREKLRKLNQQLRQKKRRKGRERERERINVRSEHVG